MSKTALAVLLCLTGLVGYTHAASLDVYKESVLVVSIQLDDPQACAKLAKILLDPANVCYKIIIYAFGFLGATDKPNTQLAIATFGAKEILILINYAVEASGGILGKVIKPLGFPEAMKNANEVAKKVGQVILCLLAAGVKLIRIILVGFSLGAHLVGAVGRVVKAGGYIILRIIGLDPANFVTAFTPIKNLDTTCAVFVLTIISNPGQLGSPISLGHANVWLNYHTKPTQPNCSACQLTAPISPTGISCSHNRAPVCFFESVKLGSIKAVGAVNGKAWMNGQTNCQVITATLDGVPLDTRGEYFCSTNGESPYGRGTAGLQPI